MGPTLNLIHDPNGVYTFPWDIVCASCVPFHVVHWLVSDFLHFASGQLRPRSIIEVSQFTIEAHGTGTQDARRAAVAVFTVAVITAQ